MPCLTVLVVEDDPLIRELVTEALLDGGFDPTPMASGEEAVAWAKSEQKELCALVTDINLGRGKVTGWDVARSIRALKTDLPVIYVSGDKGYEWSRQGVSSSMLVPKPFATAQVVTAVSQMVNIANSP